MRNPPERATLTIVAGWLTIAITIGHTISGLTIFSGQWADVLGGELHGDPLVTEPSTALLAFWFVPGSFVVPMVLLALLAIGRAREGRPLPRYVGWTLLAYTIGCAYAVFPSGHLWDFIPVTLFLIDSHRSRGAVTPDRSAASSR